MTPFEAATNNDLDAIAVEQETRAGERMLAAVHQLLGRFVSYPNEHAQVAHALWCVHAHMMDRWDSTPRLAFLSPEPACGKSRALEITGLLVPNPVQAMNVSPAYLFRKVGDEQGAPILFDEIDTVFGAKAKDNEEIRGLLNAGHRRGAVAGRCVVRGKEIITEELPAYAAVALAGIGWLPDTILTRSVVIRMRRRAPSERVEPFRSRLHEPAGHAVRTMIETWVRQQPREITWPDLPSELQDRNADVWETLIAVADLAGGDWPQRARDAAVALVAAGSDAEPSLGIRLLTDLRSVFGFADAMATATILEELARLPEAPWGDLRGRPLDQRGLANRLRQYGIKSKNVRIGETVVKGYAAADLHDAWSRYLPQQPAKSATSATSATRPPPTLIWRGEPVADVADVAQPDGQEGDETSNRRKCVHCGDRGETNLVGYRGINAWLHRKCEAEWREGVDDRLMDDPLA